MTALARIEVTGWDADAGQPRTTVVYFDPAVTHEVAKRLQPIIDEALSRIPLSGDDARRFLAAEIARLQADGDGYRREAARRGVLAL